MGRAPDLATCLFCDETPCVCARNARKKAAVRPKTPITKILEATDAIANPAAIERAPVAQSRRFSAVDAMRAASADTPPVLAIPAPIPARISPPPQRIATAVPITPATLPAPVESVTNQSKQDSDLMDYAEHLVRVRLGGVPVDQKYSNGALEQRARRVRERLHRNG